MISSSKLIAMIVTLCITLILPVIVAVVYSIKNKGKKVWQAWLLGAAGFFVLQMLIRIPILSVVSTLPAFTKLITEHYVFYKKEKRRNQWLLRSGNYFIGYSEKGFISSSIRLTL